MPDEMSVTELILNPSFFNCKLKAVKEESFSDSVYLTFSYKSKTSVSKNTQYWTSYEYFEEEKEDLSPENSNTKMNVRRVIDDPAGYMDGLNLYAAYFGVNGIDPDGLAQVDNTEGLSYTGSDSWWGRFATYWKGYQNVKADPNVWAVSPKVTMFGTVVGGKKVNHVKTAWEDKIFMAEATHEIGLGAKRNLVWMEPAVIALTKTIDVAGMVLTGGASGFGKQFIMQMIKEDVKRRTIRGGITSLANGSLQLYAEGGDLSKVKITGIVAAFTGGYAGGSQGVYLYAVTSQGFMLLTEGDISNTEFITDMMAGYLANFVGMGLDKALPMLGKFDYKNTLRTILHQERYINSLGGQSTLNTKLLLDSHNAFRRDMLDATDSLNKFVYPYASDLFGEYLDSLDD